MAEEGRERGVEQPGLLEIRQVSRPRTAPQFGPSDAAMGAALDGPDATRRPLTATDAPVARSAIPSVGPG